MHFFHWKQFQCFNWNRRLKTYKIAPSNVHYEVIVSEAEYG